MPIFEIKIVCTRVRAFATLFSVSFSLSFFSFISCCCSHFWSCSRSLYIGWRTQFTSLSRHPCSIQFLTVRVTLVVLCYSVLVSVFRFLYLSLFFIVIICRKKTNFFLFLSSTILPQTLQTLSSSSSSYCFDQTPNNYLIGLYSTILSFSSVHSRFLRLKREQPNVIN